MSPLTHTRAHGESFLVCVGISADRLVEIAELLDGTAAVLGVPDAESARALVCGEAVYVQSVNGHRAADANSRNGGQPWTSERGAPQTLDTQNTQIYSYAGRRPAAAGSCGLPGAAGAADAVVTDARGDQLPDQWQIPHAFASAPNGYQPLRDHRRSQRRLRVDSSRRQVTWRGTPIRLSAREFDLLAALARQPGHVWTFAELTELVWGRPYVGDTEAVVSAVKRLRRRVARVTADVRIDSVRGVGFRLAVVS